MEKKSHIETTKRKVNRKDAEILEEKHGSVRKGVSALVQDKYGKEEWEELLASHSELYKPTVQEMMEEAGVEPSEIKRSKHVTLDDVAISMVENRGFLMRVELERWADDIGYSGRTLTDTCSMLKRKYYAITSEEIREETKIEEKRKAARDIIEKEKELYYREEDKRDEKLDELLEEAEEKAKKGDRKRTSEKEKRISKKRASVF